MEEALLEVKDLTFAYEKKKILNKISATICRGERIAVMGSNGAGKSTFFLNINGVLTPDAGEICLNGSKVDKKNMKLLREQVGFVFQDADNQMIASTVREEISFGPMNLGLNREEVKRCTESAIDYMDLRGMEQRPPHYLSGGEKKRVTIADILAMEPEILIFDEPMAALDPLNASNVERILKKLHEEGKTLLVATHDVDFAYRFADRIFVFADGELIADKTPPEIFGDKSILARAHLKEPAVLSIWKALRHARLASDQEAAPTTPEELVEQIMLNKERGRKQ